MARRTTAGYFYPKWDQPPQSWLVDLIFKQASLVGNIAKRTNLIARLTLVAHAGLTLVELRQLQWGDVNFVARTLLAENAIGEKLGRLLPLSESMQVSLGAWREYADLTGATDPVFPERGRGVVATRRYEARELQALFEPIISAYKADRADYPEEPIPFTWRDLRHFALTRMIAAGLSHAKISAHFGDSTYVINRLNGLAQPGARRLSCCGKLFR